jgi:transposase
MFFSEGNLRVFYYAEPVDMRKSFSGLYALAKHVLREDPLSGHLFVFCNRAGNYVKCLYFDRTGFCIWAKRLERGRYVFPSGGLKKRELSWTDFKLVLEGIEIKRRRKRFGLSKAA